jgi:hypothetical protein
VLNVKIPRDIKTAEARRRGIIRVTLQASAENEYFIAGKWNTAQFIQSVQNAEANSRAAAQPACDRNVAFDRA